MSTELYPEIEPYKSEILQVSDTHRVYYEESGNPSGEPILFLHGGPGAGTSPKHRRYFNPAYYRIILMDQRGAGKSTPYAEIDENTTWHLVEDIERIREKLKISKWHVFGGSWGSTLALCYAIKFPNRINHLILRGIFLCRKEEINWFYQYGAHQIFPDYWDTYLNHIPEDERSDMVTAYYRRLTSPDEATRIAAAKAWSIWEGSALRLIPDTATMHDFDVIAVSLARIECHYFLNDCFFPSDNYILENVHVLKKVPMHIVHGRYDVVCPVKNAFDLKKACPHAELHIIADAGHAADEVGIRSKLVEITNLISNS